ncbi:NAD(P)-binding protein [Clavulina sp. PMI_390]|nr:NAD(P)-binding protein [Clavulina sp. PMI_390]
MALFLPVRTAAKGDYLVGIHKSSAFSYTIVENIDAANAFDDAVKGGDFDGITHIASPLRRVSDPNDLIGPSVAGTKNVLNAALKFGPNIKRVVVTSSSVAMLEPHSTPYTYTESDWNDASIRAVEEKGAKASLPEIFFASKTLSERAAWTFVEEHKGELTFDIVAICPPWMFGPIIHDAPSIDTLNFSHGFFRRILKANESSLLPEATGSTEYLSDVRDVAVAHARAFTVEEAGGKRFLAAGAAWTHQDVYDILNEAGIQGIPKGHPGSQSSEFNVQDNAQSVRVLGMKCNGLKDIVLSTHETLKEHFPSEF